MAKGEEFTEQDTGDDAGRCPLAPEFTTTPGERTAHPNPTFVWIPAGDCHDFQLADNDQFEHPIIDHLKTYDLTASLEPGFPTDGTADKTYYYRVRGHNNVGPGPWNTKSFEFRSKLPPKPVFTVGPQKRTPDHQLHFKWAAAEAIDTFEFQIAKDPEFEDAIVSETIKGKGCDILDKFSSTGEHDGTYYFRVRSMLGKDDYSEWSFDPEANSFELVTRPRPPEFNLRPDTRTNNPRPRFGWDASQALGAVRFRFEISNIFDFSGQVISHETEDVSETAYIMEGKLPKGTYYYRICSLDPHGKSGVWNYDPSVNRFTLNPQKPNEPIVEVPEYITGVPMPISGTKDPGSSVLLNGETLIPQDEEMAWSTQGEIFLGVNVLVFHTSDAQGNLSNPVVKTCTYDPPMRNNDFYTRDSLDDHGEEPGEAEYGSAPDTIILGPMERLKIDPQGPDTRDNFDSEEDHTLFTKDQDETLRWYLSDPERLGGTHRLDPAGKNLIFVRIQNKGFRSGACQFRLFWAPYSTWPKASQWVEITKESTDEEGNPTRWHYFPEEIAGSNSEMVVTEPIVWGPEDPGFPVNGEHGCVITIIQAENLIEDPSFLLDRPTLEGSYLLQMLDAYPEVFRLATYLSNNVTFKNINVVCDVAVKPEEGKRGKEQLVPIDEIGKKGKVPFKNPQPSFWKERVLINGPSLKTPDASLVLDVSNFDENGSVWLKVPKDLLPPSRRWKVAGGVYVGPDEEMSPELTQLLFEDPTGYLVFKVTNEYEMEVGHLDLGINQKTHAELVYGLSVTASENVQYTVSLIQKFANKEVGRVMSIVKTQQPTFYPYFADVKDNTLHKRDCKALKKMHGEDLRPFASVADARLDGFKPCGNCFK